MGDGGGKGAHTWSFEVQKSGAEHFVTFLYSEKHLNGDYSISKSDFYRALRLKYQPRYHWNQPPCGVLSLLLRCRFIKKQSVKQDDNILHFDAHRLLPVVKKLKNSAKSNGVLRPLDERVTQPVETIVVSQQTAFRPKQKRKAGLSAQKCDICQVTFSSQASQDAHKDTEIHQLREVYRNDRKSLYASKEVCVYTSKNAKGMEKCVTRPGKKGTMKLYIGNFSKNVKCVENIISLIDLPEVQIKHSEVPLSVPRNAEIPLLLDYKFTNVGSYLYPLVLRVRKKSAEDTSYVLKEIVFSCQSELVDDLQPVSKYKQTLPAKFKISEGPIEAGLALPPIRTGLAQERKLLSSLIPVDLQTLLNHELKTYATISKNLQSKLKELKDLLGLDEKMETVSRCALQPETYCKLFSTLLHIEEHQMNIDIRKYDCNGMGLKKIKGSPLLAMNVPGLAEKRPSVLKGDSIYVVLEGDSKKVRYEGFVHNVNESELHLGFSESFCNAYTEGMKLHVQFKFSRYPLQVEHRALNMLEKCEGGKFMLPKENKGIRKPVITIKLWKNRDVENNEQQMIAVTNIVNNTAYPAPYIVFGPPGTGKTVTIVEAIVQLWSLHKTDKKKHILVCAPSNAAADVLSVRLLKYVPPSVLLRLYASSCSYDSVPEVLRKRSNFDERGSCFYPTKTEVMTFPIIVVTLVTAAKLVGARIPAGHFSHVFVDECGHAVEPEVLVPVVGLLIRDEEPATMKGQLVLAGDPKQLGPILRSPLAISLGLGMSLLERLMEDEQLYKRNVDTQQYDPAVLTKLVKNFRSHESILAVSNRLFYDGELQVCGGPEISLACSWEELPKNNFPIIFHGIVGQDAREASSPSFFNVMEIDVVLSYLDNLFEDRLKGRKVRQNDIGIVTPYRKQVEKIKAALRKKNWGDVDVGSVEEFQGQERLVIIISTVRSSHQFVPDDYKFQLGFLKNPKRLNVALTRAKALLVVVGNPNILQCDIHWRTFITYCIANGAYRGVQFTRVTNDEGSVDSSLVNGVARLCLNPGESSNLRSQVTDDGAGVRAGGR